MKRDLEQKKRDLEEKAYKIYVTDSLKSIAENTARYAGGGYPAIRYADLIEQKPHEEKSGEEIVADVIKKSGLVVK